MHSPSALTNPIKGKPVWSPVKSLWFTTMALTALIGGWSTFAWDVAIVAWLLTIVTLCLGHSIGLHRLLIGLLRHLSITRIECFSLSQTDEVSADTGVDVILRF